MIKRAATAMGGLAVLVTAFATGPPAHATSTAQSAFCGIEVGAVTAAGDHGTETYTATSPPTQTGSTARELILVRVWFPAGPTCRFRTIRCPTCRARGMGVQEDGAGIARPAGRVDAGSLQLRVVERFALRDIRAAHERFEAGGLVGKIVIEF